MTRMTIHLPNTLAEQIRKQGLSGKALDKFVVNALQLKMRQPAKPRKAKQKTIAILRKAGVVLSASAQSEFADAVLARLPSRNERVTRAQVEKSLSKLQTPLSAEIVVMRGER